MTEEELEKEAEKYADKHTFYDEGRDRQYYDVLITQIFEDGAEFGYNKAKEEFEKENTELKSLNKEITDDCHKLVNALENWQNENVELLGKVAFLENDLNNAKAQIEKMKCCGNCKHQCSFLFQEDIDCFNNNLSNWELGETLNGTEDFIKEK